MNTDDGRIELSVPADSRYMRLARLMASGVASTCGLPLEEVEDFRIAVDELCSTLIEMGDGHPIRLSFELGRDSLVVRASTRRRRTYHRRRAHVAQRQILDVVTDGHTLDHVDGSVELVARARAGERRRLKPSTATFNRAPDICAARSSPAGARGSDGRTIRKATLRSLRRRGRQQRPQAGRVGEGQPGGVGRSSRRGARPAPLDSIMARSPSAIGSRPRRPRRPPGRSWS